jgi:hypothetical protein
MVCEHENTRRRRSSSCLPMQWLTMVVSYVGMEVFVRVGSPEQVRAHSTQGCSQTPGEPMSTRTSTYFINDSLYLCECGNI